MKRILMAHDLLDSNGKTVKQNNMKKQHKIPLGSLVEVDGSGGAEEFDGLRLFVVGHTRDCDGTPLYCLSYDKEVSLEELEKSKKFLEVKSLSPQEQTLTQTNYWFLSGKITSGFSEESLKIILKKENVSGIEKSETELFIQDLKRNDEVFRAKLNECFNLFAVMATTGDKRFTAKIDPVAAIEEFPKFFKEIFLDYFCHQFFNYVKLSIPEFKPDQGLVDAVQELYFFQLKDIKAKGLNLTKCNFQIKISQRTLEGPNSMTLVGSFNQPNNCLVATANRYWKTPG